MPVKREGQDLSVCHKRVQPFGLVRMEYGAIGLEPHIPDEGLDERRGNFSTDRRRNDDDRPQLVPRLQESETPPGHCPEASFHVLA